MNAVDPLPSRLESLTDLMAVIAHVEDHHPVDRWRVGGIEAWPVARIQLGHSLFRSMDDIDVTRSTSVAALAARGLQAILAGRSAVAAPRSESTSAVFLADGASFVATSAGLVDRTCDPLRMALEARGTSSTLLVPGPDRRSVVGRSVPIQPGLDRAVLRNRARRRPPVDLDGYEQARAELDDAGLVGMLPSAAALTRRVGDIGAIAARLEATLSVIDPDVVVVSEFYSATGMGLMVAAHRRGIPTIDVQHGVQGAFHFGYANWSRLPAGGSEMLPRRFWVWSEAEAASIAAWAPEGRQRSIVGGNGYLHATLDGTLPGAAEATADVARILADRGARGLVLVALGGIEPQPFVDAVLDAAASTPDLVWAVRCHPTVPHGDRWNAAVGSRRLANVEVDESSDLPLFSLLGSADAVVTRFSSVTIDAAAIGVPTLLVDELGEELFADLVASGEARRVALSGAALSAAVGATPARAAGPGKSPTSRFGAGVDAVLELAEDRPRDQRRTG